MYYVIGLGNPGEQYVNTRHNAGRIVVNELREQLGFPNWSTDRFRNVSVSEGSIGTDPVVLINSETFMNRSGQAVQAFATQPEDAERAVVVYDDIDLPLGSFKLSFNRGSGGHRGVESVIKALQTKAFLRIRVGITPVSFFGKLKKPKGDAAIQRFILGAFTSGELRIIKTMAKPAQEIIERLVRDGREHVMSAPPSLH